MNIDLDRHGISHRIEEAPWQFHVSPDDKWHEATPLEDFLLTFGPFVLGLAPIVAVAAWMLM